MDIFPNLLFFFDDKLKQILAVEEFCTSYKIKFLGYRYGYLDEKIKNTNFEVANIEQKNFKDILSDSEASSMIQ